jgi:hypothetical protein
MPAAQVKGKVDAIVTYHVEGLAQDPPSASPPGKA